MSGDGVLTFRLPTSLDRAVRSAAEFQGIRVHEWVRRVICLLATISPDDVRGLREPPRVMDTRKASLYIGWRAVDVLTITTRNSKLTNSTILRRLLYGLLVTKEIEIVQQDEYWKLRISKSKSGEKSAYYNAEKGPSCA
jgi:hypothetical protein